MFALHDNPLLSLVLVLVFVMLSLGLVLSFLRLAIGPTLADRVVALEAIASLVVGFAAAYAVAMRDPVFLDIAIVLALVAFIAAVAFASFIEKRGRI
jgi:multicomponent Na+:H+ antiporter subunit F